MTRPRRSTWELKSHCEGLHFRYYREDKNGRYRSVSPNQRFRHAEEFILKRIREMLANRPDLMMKIACFPGGVEVRLYEGGELTDATEGADYVARATDAGDHILMEFAIGEIEYAHHNGDGIDVVVHEIAHVLNFFTEEEGILPGWTSTQKKRFKQARAHELERLKSGESILHYYASANHTEFLAVLAEAFFKTPAELKATNRVLYDLMAEYFRLEP